MTLKLNLCKITDSQFRWKGREPSYPCSSSFSRFPHLVLLHLGGREDIDEGLGGVALIVRLLPG